MTLPTLRKLTWLSVLLCFVSWIATAESPNPDSVPARLAVPDPNAPVFLI